MEDKGGPYRIGYSGWEIEVDHIQIGYSGWEIKGCTISGMREWLGDRGGTYQIGDSGCEIKVYHIG